MPFTVLAKSLTGAVFPITLETGTASVADLRAAIVKRLGVPLPPDALQVWYDGAPLDRAEQSMRAAGIGSGDSVVVCLGKPLPRALVRPTTTTKRSKKASDDVLDPFTPQPRLVDRMRQIIAKRQVGVPTSSSSHVRLGQRLRTAIERHPARPATAAEECRCPRGGRRVVCRPASH